MPVSLRGHHVDLVPLNVSHAGPLWALADEATWTYLIHPVRDEADMARWIDRRLAGHGGRDRPYAMVETTGRVIGTTSLYDIERRAGRAKVGWTWIGAPHRGGPANAESKLLLLTQAFDAMALDRVHLQADGRNEASCAAMEAWGARREGILRHHMTLPDGSSRDVAVYSVVRRDWPAVRRLLAGRVQAKVARRG